MRQPISAEEKLAVTLRFLATGESYQSLQYQFRISRSTIGLFIPKVCKVIYEVLQQEYFSIPTTEKEWIDLADATELRWQFPNAFAAANGKHVALFHPHDSGGTFYNYKGFYSIVLMAFVDFDYKFLYADVGCQGRVSDGGVYRNSSFAQQISSLQLKLPADRPLPRSRNPAWEPFETDDLVPFVFVADSAFPLSRHCMKPFPEKGLDDRRRIFNYRLSRFRRISENAFGILTSIFRMFGAKLNLHPDKAIAIVKAALVLHNLLRSKSPESYTPAGLADEVSGDAIIDGQWRAGNATTLLKPLPPRARGNRPTASAENVREILADHFYGPGQVPWQWKCIV